ncbi:D,D-heptose 1,7-bisphosphate phosphatase [Candidatus Magnetomorum sp. HK-1]|nr:D,D-heptose 1,7-bisphosphate phosphatase [Candidatus Magnetomorum sp. HK-1]
MNAVILAGGKGTRISSIFPDIPKSMIPIQGKSLLQHQIEQLRAYDIHTIHMCLGYLANAITDHFGSGFQYGVELDYEVETTPQGTAGSLYLLKDRLEDDFIVINGDIIFNVDLLKIIDYHKQKGGIATLTTHITPHPLESDLVEADENNKITHIFTRPHAPDFDDSLYANAGIMIFSPKMFEYITKHKKQNIEKHILTAMLNNNELIFSYPTDEYIHDTGTVERYHEVVQDVMNGKLAFF